MEIKFVVYGEPVAKARARVTFKNGKTFAFTPSKTRTAEYNFRTQSLAHKPVAPLDCPIALRVRVYRSMPKSFSSKKIEQAEKGFLRPTTRPDGDNYLKLVCDSMNKIFWNDDSQVVDNSVSKFYSATPRIEIELKTLPGPDSLFCGQSAAVENK